MTAVMHYLQSLAVASLVAVTGFLLSPASGAAAAPGPSVVGACGYDGAVATGFSATSRATDLSVRVVPASGDDIAHNHDSLHWSVATNGADVVDDALVYATRAEKLDHIFVTRDCPIFGVTAVGIVIGGWGGCGLRV